MPNPTSFLKHLRAHGYHSRSNKHSNSLAEAIARDLVQHCPRIREKAKAGNLVYALNFTITAGPSDSNVDLVLGAPPLDRSGDPTGSEIIRQPPSRVEIAIELKSIMTAHHKAAKNRKRDLESHHEHVHNYSNKAIAGSVLLINAASTFDSPMRDGLSQHARAEQDVKHCLNLLRAVTTRRDSSGSGMEASCAIVVNMDNVNLDRTRYVERPPAPSVGDPLHYDAFIQSICQAYTDRF